MQLDVAKKSGLERIMQNIYQNVYLLNKRDGAPKFAEPGMIDHLFLIHGKTDNNPISLSIQTNILFRAEFSVTDLRIPYRLEQLSMEKIIGEYITLCQVNPSLAKRRLAKYINVNSVC